MDNDAHQPDASPARSLTYQQLLEVVQAAVAICDREDTHDKTYARLLTDEELLALPQRVADMAEENEQLRASVRAYKSLI